MARYLREAIPTKQPRIQAGEEKKAAALAQPLSRYSLTAITPDAVADYRDTRLATIGKRTKRTISPATVRLELALVGQSSL